MTNLNALQAAAVLRNYYLGDREQRPWGYFEVLDVGFTQNEEFCEKRISVLPRQALSLQRHQFRREVWNVVEGELTVILDGKVKKLTAGQSINIPLKSVHCMVNLTDKEVVIHERQIGVCREEDNDRLSDLSGRETVVISKNDVNALVSIQIYEKMVERLIPKTS